MVSLVVVGPPMSGKTHLCVRLAGLPSAQQGVYNDTRSIDYLKTDIDGRPWHIWDTPAYEQSGWAGTEIIDTADVIVVCHDGRRRSNPCDIIADMDANKCIIALTRTPVAGANLSYMVQYFRTTTSYGTLLPVVNTYHSPAALVSVIKSLAPPEDSDVRV